ncbi:MAG: Rrf2 family transcriptional regulator [Armatimonadetes bacterium]|nr:Rrf2 family transcriptional regulator [Armatimonadota bacterium]
MRLGNTTKYAFESLAYLIRSHARDEWAQIADIAAQSNIPRKYLEQVLLDLKSGGILESKKGQGGGYRLSRSPDQISIGQVLGAIQGELLPLPEWLDDNRATFSTDSGLGDVVRQARDTVGRLFDQTSIEVLVCRPETWV